MRISIHRFSIAAVLVLTLAAPALAQTAEELRRDNMACEQADGYMRATNPDAQAAVQAINDQRREFYQMRAAEEGVDVAAVAAVYAGEIRSQPNYRACP